MVRIGPGEIVKIGKVYDPERLAPIADNIKKELEQPGMKYWSRPGFRTRFEITQNESSAKLEEVHLDKAFADQLSEGFDGFATGIVTRAVQRYPKLRQITPTIPSPLVIRHHAARLGWHVDAQPPHLRLLTNLSDSPATVQVATEWDCREGRLDPYLDIEPIAYEEISLDFGESYLISNTPPISMRRPHAVGLCDRLMLQQWLEFGYLAGEDGGISLEVPIAE